MNLHHTCWYIIKQNKILNDTTDLVYYLLFSKLEPTFASCVKPNLRKTVSKKVKFKASHKLLISCCRVAISVADGTERYTLQSSANFWMWIDTTVSMAFTNMRKRVDPRTEPCGMPDRTSCNLEYSPFKTSLYSRLYITIQKSMLLHFHHEYQFYAKAFDEGLNHRFITHLKYGRNTRIFPVTRYVLLFKAGVENNA